MATTTATTFDHLAKKKPATSVQYVPLDEDVQAELEDAAQAYGAVRYLANDEQVAKAKAKLDAALAKFHLPENSVRVEFKAIGRVKFDKLKGQHAPTEKQLADAEKANEQVDWNADTFMAPLISVSVTSPKMTVDQVNSLTAPEEEGGYAWNEGEISALFNEALRINLAGRIGSYSF